MSFSINAKLALIFVGAMVFLGTILFFIMTKAHPYFKAVFEKWEYNHSSDIHITLTTKHSLPIWHYIQNEIIVETNGRSY